MKYLHNLVLEDEKLKDSFEVKKEKGMKYEPYDVQATVRMIFADGSEETQEFNNHITTNIRERKRVEEYNGTTKSKG